MAVQFWLYQCVELIRDRGVLVRNPCSVPVQVQGLAGASGRTAGRAGAVPVRCQAGVGTAVLRDVSELGWKAALAMRARVACIEWRSVSKMSRNKGDVHL